MNFHQEHYFYSYQHISTKTATTKCLMNHHLPLQLWQDQALTAMMILQVMMMRNWILLSAPLYHPINNNNTNHPVIYAVPWLAMMTNIEKAITCHVLTRTIITRTIMMTTHAFNGWSKMIGYHPFCFQHELISKEHVNHPMTRGKDQAIHRRWTWLHHLLSWNDHTKVNFHDLTPFSPPKLSPNRHVWLTDSATCSIKVLRFFAWRA